MEIYYYYTIKRNTYFVTGNTNSLKVHFWQLLLGVILNRTYPFRDQTQRNQQNTIEKNYIHNNSKILSSEFFGAVVI